MFIYVIGKEMNMSQILNVYFMLGDPEPFPETNLEFAHSFKNSTREKGMLRNRES